ncbi:MAG: hypothetical protein ACLUFN_04695 [Eubacterium sp.]
MKNAYKELYDEIRPDEKLVESVFEMRDRKKKKHLVPKIVSAVLALVLLVGGTGFGIQYNENQKLQKNPIGCVMLANASEAIGQSSVNIAYKISVKDITGLSDKEIQDLKVKALTEEMNYSSDEFTLNDALKNVFTINGNAMYATERSVSGANFVLKNIDNPENVAKISASNTSDYGYVYVECNDLYFKEVEEDVFVESNNYSDVDYDKSRLIGHDVSVEGSRYALCRRIESADTKVYSYHSYYELDEDDEFYMMEIGNAVGYGYAFNISYMFSDDFYNALGENPAMDLTSYKDDYTITVDFKDGYTATTVLEIGLKENGQMTAKCVSYDYNKTK